MSIYIKGMEMPKSCAKCKLFGEYGCPFVGPVGYALTEGRRNEYCPLVPVPPHGRLIDADAIKKEFDRICDEFDACIIDEMNCLNMILASFDNAPTTIPAEEDE